MQLSYFVDKATISKVEPDPLTQISKSISSGIILSPLNKKKTEMDIYRHFKAYKVVGRAEPISLS